MTIVKNMLVLRVLTSFLKIYFNFHITVKYKINSKEKLDLSAK